MSIREKLNQMKEIEARNKGREREFLQAQKLEAYVEAIHKTIEIYAEAVHGCIDITAQHYGVGRSELLGLLISTLQALDQIKEQEG